MGGVYDTSCAYDDVTICIKRRYDLKKCVWKILRIGVLTIIIARYENYEKSSGCLLTEMFVA